MEFLSAQGPDVLNACVETVMQYEMSLLGQVQNQAASAMPTRFVAMPDEEAKPRPLRVDVSITPERRGKISPSGSVRLRWP